MKDAPRIEPLKKVHAKVQVEAGAANPPPSCFEVAFIYGIGSDGMPPFERLLAGKGEGDQITFRVTKPETDEFFGHLAPPFAALFDRQAEVSIRIHIARIETPEARDVVKAMAEMVAGGYGGGCDCGCGCR
ncbi:MAG: hypothetical protein ACM3KE_03975 [Hyphomicrobiales bacterium]